MELIIIYKIIGIVAFLTLIVSLFIKKNKKLHAVISFLFKVFAVGYYFMTFFIKGNKFSLIINYALLLIAISLFVFTTVLRKHLTKTSKSVIGTVFLLLIIGLLINGFFI